MSSVRKTDHRTTHDDAVPQGIALLLADAADAVEIGTAPYQAVVRGGRRRKARRLTVAAVTAVVIAGSIGTLAVAGMTDGAGDRVSPAATRPSTAKERHVYEPQKTTVETGHDSGKDWEVTVDVWGAPRNEAEADRQYEAMKRTYKVAEVVIKPGSSNPTAPDQSAWIGKSRLYVRLTVGDQRSSVVEEGFAEGGVPLGRDPQTYTTPLLDHLALKGESDDTSNRQLVIGKVAPSAQQVRVTWSDGTTTEIDRDEVGTGDQDPQTPRLVDAAGSRTSWFVVLAPKGLSHDSTEVTK